MQLSAILLFLLLWGKIEVSLTQNACSNLPDVPHAFVSEDTKKDEYLEGHMIQFTCEPGYTSSQTSKYVCLRDGWLTVRQGMCYSCSTLPDVPHAAVSADTKKAAYQEGDMIQFTCEPGYTSGSTITYVCASTGWLAVHQGTCHFSASGCEPPPSDGGTTVKGLPENEGLIVADHILTFSCDGPGKQLDGHSVLICGEDGQWNNPFPSCLDITCKAEEMHDQLFVAGLPRADETMTPGHKLRFQCGDEYTLVGAKETECLSSGQWSAPFPTCAADKCKVTGVPGSVIILTLAPNNQLMTGQKLTFACLLRGHFLRGSAEVECLAGGQWSGPFPTCGDPLGCGNPPPLADGDTKERLKLSYRHYERVEYVCQNLYTMEGDPYRTCINGEWTGQMRCLKPCTVNREAMSRHNIAFKYSHEEKLYAPHYDTFTFTCIGGRRHDGQLNMQQRCLDGVINLPTCV